MLSLVCQKSNCPESSYTTFGVLTFLTTRKARTFSFQDQTYRPVLVPKQLIKNRQANWGVDIIVRQGLDIKITNIERTIVDMLGRPDLAGGWEEIWRSLDYLVQFDAEKIVDYAIMLANATTVAKVGYYLEQLPEHLSVASKTVEKLVPYCPKQPHYMNRDRQGKGKYFKKWQLVVPLEIVERRWDEQYDNDN